MRQFFSHKIIKINLDKNTKAILVRNNATSSKSKLSKGYKEDTSTNDENIALFDTYY